MSIDPPLPLPPSFQAATSPLTFVLNRTKVQLSAQDNVDVTLLEFLRSSGFSGTKLGCGEGGCGSCSVVLGRYSRRNRTEEQVSENPTPYEYKSVNACLLPLIAVHGAHVITVEGIGNSENPHPVQERMAKLFGSQCGYCTPGFVMALYATLRSHAHSSSLSEQELESSLDGNLCRCTSHRPILDAAKSFAFDKSQNSTPFSSGSESSSSPATDYSPPTSEEERGFILDSNQIAKQDSETKEILASNFSCPKGDQCCKVDSSATNCSSSSSSTVERTAPDPVALGFKPYHPGSYQDLIFPPFLAKNKDKFDSEDLVFVGNSDLGLKVQPLVGAWGAKHGLEADDDDDQEGNAPKKVGGKNSIWFRPGSISSLIEIINFYDSFSKDGSSPSLNLRSGNTETGIEFKFKGSRWDVSVFVSDHLPSLGGISIVEKSDGTKELEIGANYPLNSIASFLRLQVERASSHDSSSSQDQFDSYEVQVYKSILSALSHFASNQIRNVSTIGGNVTTASPISDLNPVWVALDAKAKYLDTRALSKEDFEGKEAAAILQSHEKSIPMREFFTGYRKTALPAAAFLTKMTVSLGSSSPSATLSKDGWTEKSFTRSFKQAKRKDDDIAIVTCCFNLSISFPPSSDSGSSPIVKHASLVYGGMAPTTTSAFKTQEFLVGKPFFSQETLLGCMETLNKQDFDLPFSVPGGMASYRKSLATGFFARFYSQVGEEIKWKYGGNQPLDGSKQDQLLSLLKIEEIGGSELHRPVTRAAQDLEDVDVDLRAQKLKGGSGESVPHLSALKQATGEAIYIDDMPNLPHELYASLVLSTKPHANLLSVDPTEALSMPGVVDFVSVKDIPAGGSNIWCPPAMDDVFFADGKVESVGQVIAVITATSKRAADDAARKVKIDYEELPFILTIDEAIEKESFFKPRPVLRLGDCERDWEKEEKDDNLVILEGTSKMGGQEHFYLETNAAIAIPGEDGEMEVFTSSQNLAETQTFVSSLLGTACNRTLVRAKRIGGGFGGKETRPVLLAGVVALSARKAGRPVRIQLDRDVDMMFSGQRHAFSAKWKIAASRDGQLKRLEIEVVNNGGYSQDLSSAVLERSLFHISNCYRFETLKVSGKIAKTNTPSNTAFRGFGGPQGMAICEDFMYKLAAQLQIPVETLREKNLYKEGNKTHYGQPLKDWNVPVLWKTLRESCKFDERKKEIEEFNQVNTWKKRGISVVPTAFGVSYTALFLNQANAMVQILNHDGSVQLSHGGIEMGQGLNTKMAQVAATCLNIDMSKIYTRETSTGTIVNASATAASASSDLNGMAIKNACELLNERLKPFRYPNGEDGEEVKWETAIHNAYFARVNLSQTGHYKTPDIGFNWSDQSGVPFFYFTQGVCATEMELDVLTGDSRVVRTDIKLDLGRSINPQIDVGQIEGAWTQGLGLFTIEELLWNRKGELMTKGPGNYKIPAVLDTPAIMNISFLKTSEGRKSQNLKTIHGSKGVGEPPLFLANSALQALKQCITSVRASNPSVKNPALFNIDSPATPERIRLACGDGIVEQARVEPKEGEKDFFVSIF